MTFGQKVKTYRKSKTMTLKELAEKTGLSASTICLYEKGKRKKPLSVSKKAIAAALGVEPSELDDDEEEGEKDDTARDQGA